MGERNRSCRPTTVETPTVLPSDLEQLVSDASLAARDVRTAEAENAYRLALLAQASTGRRLDGGGSAIEACAKRLGLARSTLQSFSALARCWSLQELRAIFARAQNGSLSVSHLLLVSQLPRSARDRWVENVLAEGFGVRRLRSTMAEQAIRSCPTVRHSQPQETVVVDSEEPKSTES